MDYHALALSPVGGQNPKFIHFKHLLSAPYKQFYYKLNSENACADVFELHGDNLFKTGFWSILEGNEYKKFGKETEEYIREYFLKENYGSNKFVFKLIKIFNLEPLSTSDVQETKK